MLRYNIILAFSWMDWGKPQKPQAMIRTWSTSNTSREKRLVLRYNQTRSFAQICIYVTAGKQSKTRLNMKRMHACTLEVIYFNFWWRLNIWKRLIWCVLSFGHSSLLRRSKGHSPITDWHIKNSNLWGRVSASLENGELPYGGLVGWNNCAAFKLTDIFLGRVFSKRKRDLSSD
jgi:hypothetical protein